MRLPALLVPLLLVASAALAHQEAGPGPAPAAQQDVGAARLFDTDWRLTHIGETVVTLKGAPREAHITFERGGAMVGADGCNTFHGSFQIKDDSLTIRTPMLGTLVNCTLPDELDRRFLDALRRTNSWKVVATELTLFDAQGAEVARFEGRLR